MSSLYYIQIVTSTSDSLRHAPVLLSVTAADSGQLMVFRTDALMLSGASTPVERMEPCTEYSFF